MRKGLKLIFLLSCTIYLVACNSNEEVTPPIADKEKRPIELKASKTEAEMVSTKVPENFKDREAVETYVTEVREIYMETTNLGAQWDALRIGSSTGEVTPPEFAEVIRTDLLPQNMAIIEVIEAIVPPNDEIARTHELFIDAINKQHIAFSEVATAMDTYDSNKMTKANEILSEVRKLDREFGREMENLLLEYNID
ncbi:hypothetical protein [uncultured Psychrobacillus sp.]|uniref:hypothetical protein n=1 Tax=uncultured Psychrobacillus sp. TaxID=1551585 RepID=UPI00262466CF|nr:hypothetical protein [uncultured Psychrobacillus sp.]